MPLFDTYKEPPFGFFPPDPTLFEVAAELMRELNRILTAAQIQHIGSTSIPGMPGKNSINILIATEKGDFSSVLTSLEAEGAALHPYKQDPEDRPVRVGGYKGRAVHLHVVERGSKNHLRAVFFGDYLKKNPEVAKEYAEFKGGLFKMGLSPEEYAAQKQAFIQKILAYLLD
jgi:dephospho-CoA kinase